MADTEREKRIRDLITADFKWCLPAKEDAWIADEVQRLMDIKGETHRKAAIMADYLLSQGWSAPGAFERGAEKMREDVAKYLDEYKYGIIAVNVRRMPLPADDGGD